MKLVHNIEVSQAWAERWFPYGWFPEGEPENISKVTDIQRHLEYQDEFVLTIEDRKGRVSRVYVPGNDTLIEKVRE